MLSNSALRPQIVLLCFDWVLKQDGDCTPTHQETHVYISSRDAVYFPEPNY
jgi:hypothetical protein